MIKRIMPLAVVVCLLVACLSVSAFAVESNELDVYDFASSVVIDGSNEIVRANLPLTWSWFRYHDNKLLKTASGARFTYTSQMRYVDNDIITGHNPDGKIIPSEGIPSGLTVSGNFVISFDVTGQTQSYDINWKLQCSLVNKGWGVIDNITLAESTQHGTSAPTVNTMPWSFDTDLLADAYGFYFFLTIDLAGVANESDVTTVTVDTSCSTAQIVIPYSQLYRLQEQTNSTNKLLDSIDSAMKDNGLKLDDVIKEQQAIKDEIDNAVNGEVPPVKPDGSGEVDDFHDKEEELWGSVSGGTQQADQVVLGAGAVIRDLATPFVVAASICNILWTRDPFWDLLYVSLALGVVASILGLGVAAARSSSEKSKGGKK